MNFQDLQNRLTTSLWSEEAQKQINSFAPKLGRRLLGYLYLIVPKLGSYVSAEEVTKAAAVTTGWSDLLQKNASARVLKQLLELWQNSNAWTEPVILYTILDIRANMVLSKGVTPELSRLFNLVECIYFDKLLPREVVTLLKNNAASMAAVADLSEEIKRYYYLRDMEREGATGLTNFKLALEQNVEEIGIEPLSLLDGSARPTVGNWLKAFGENSSKFTGRGSYNIAFFVTNHPVATKLNDSDRAVVADLLRLYAWMLRPEIFADEMLHYETERLDYYNSVKADLMAIAAQKETILAKSAIDAIASGIKPVAKAQTKLGGVIIDQTGTASKIQAKPFQALPEGYQLGQSAGITLGGLATTEGTNIQIDAESLRLQQEREAKLKSIQSKLDDLRKRNNQH